MTEFRTMNTSVHKEILRRLDDERTATANDALQHLVASGYLEAARSLRAHFVGEGGEEQQQQGRAE